MRALLVFIALIALAILGIERQGVWKWLGRGALSILSIGFAWTFSVLPLLFLSIMIDPMVALAGVVLLLDGLLLLQLKIWGLRRLPQIARWLLIGVAVAAIAGGAGRFVYQQVQKNIPTVSGELDLRQYQPFEQGSKVAVLQQPATLQLKENLPRVDCALALYPVMSAFVQAVYPQGDYPVYAERGPVRYTNTVKAYERLIAGETDVIFVAGPSQAQLDAAAAQGVKLLLTPIGREAFVFFVNAKNPVDGLTVAQIQDIYSGALTNWSEVGGRKQAIRAFQRPKGSGSQTMLEKLMEGKRLIEPLQEDLINPMGGIIEQTADYKNHRNALGYSFRFFCTEMVQNSQIKLLCVDGVYPNRESIQNGTYPLTANFYAVSTDRCRNLNVPVLLEWICSPQGQQLIEQTGYVGLEGG